MLIVGLNGSPRPDGGTALLLEAALSDIGSNGVSTVMLQVIEGLRDQKTPYCVHCSSPCRGVCYKDTKLEEMFSVLRRADGIIVGSPVYFCTVSAPLKAFWDKTRKLRREHALINVVGGCVTSGGSRYGGQESTLQALISMMLCQGMTVVGDGYQNDDPGHLGACLQYQPESDNKEGQERARILGRRVLEVARMTQTLRNNGKG